MVVDGFLLHMAEGVYRFLSICLLVSNVWLRRTENGTVNLDLRSPF